jgi:hypothetical protein
MVPLPILKSKGKTVWMRNYHMENNYTILHVCKIGLNRNSISYVNFVLIFIRGSAVRNRCSQIHSPWRGIKLTPAYRVAVPACHAPYVTWRAGTTTLCQSWLFPPSRQRRLLLIVDPAEDCQDPEDDASLAQVHNSLVLLKLQLRQ